MKPQVIRVSTGGESDDPKLVSPIPAPVVMAMRFVDQIHGHVLCPVMQTSQEPIGATSLNMRVFRELSVHEKSTYESALNILETYFVSAHNSVIDAVAPLAGVRNGVRGVDRT